MTTAIRVLLVEDDRFLRRAGEAMLTRNGFTVRTAVDGEDALAAAADFSADIVLLDLVMPKLNGFDVLRRLKADPATAAIPVVVLSNLGQTRDVQEARALGAVDYLVKANLALPELPRVVRAVLAGVAASHA